MGRGHMGRAFKGPTQLRSDTHGGARSGGSGAQ